MILHHILFHAHRHLRIAGFMGVLLYGGLSLRWFVQVRSREGRRQLEVGQHSQLEVASSGFSTQINPNKGLGRRTTHPYNIGKTALYGIHALCAVSIVFFSKLCGFRGN